MTAALSATAVTSAAIAKTGLTDWGSPIFLQSLEVLCNAIEREAQIRDSSCAALRERLVDIACGRLQLIDDRKHDPAISAATVREPLFIIGLPRAGSTFCNHLLANDPDNRVSRLWEAMLPSPPPRAETYDCDPRIAIAQDKLLRHGFTNPALIQIHPFDARHPEAMAYLLDYAGMFHLAVALHVPSFEDYLATIDETEAFGFQKCVLQHLQAHTPHTRWVLKGHLKIDGVRSAYPDAKFIINHRDPAKVIPSITSLFIEERRLYSDRPVDGANLMRNLVKRFGVGMRKLIEKRDAAGDQGDILDLTFTELTQTPVATMRRIYDFFGWKLGDDVIPRTERFLAEQSRGKGGRHSYTLEQFGMSLNAVDESFGKDYLERFSIVPEIIRS